MPKVKIEAQTRTTAVVAENRLKQSESDAPDKMRLCNKCFQLYPSDHTCCDKCGEPHSPCVRSKEEPEEASGRCPMCKERKETSQAACPSCSKLARKIAHVNPIPKPPRSGIDSSEFRILLIGKTGAGKSATGNTLMKENLFKSSFSMKSVTAKCQYRRKQRWGHEVLIVDTPGIFDTSKKEEDISKEIKKCISIAAPGPHAFLLVISLTNRFTQEEQNVLKELDGIFGEHMMKYLIVVFTGRDLIKNLSPEDYLKESPKELRKVLDAAGGSYITFNNEGELFEKENDAQNLFDRIKEMVNKNGGSYFTSLVFDEAEEIMQARISKERELRTEIEQELRNEMKETMRTEREHFQKLHEANVENMEKMKLELKAEKENRFQSGRKGGKLLGELVHEEMELIETKNELIQQIAKSEGTERAKLQHQLDDVVEEIKQIIAKWNTVEEEITEERIHTAIREEERKNIEKEEQNTLDKFMDGIKHIGSRFLNLFK